MRYIADSDGYIMQISFGADISCNGADCVEYTGAVPSQYSSLESWYQIALNNNELCYWRIVDGNLTWSYSADRARTDNPNFIESTDFPGCFYRTVDGETEWLNPPMIAGEEYRLIEKWSGKAVYTCNISLGKSTATASTIDTSYLATNIIRTGGAMGRFGNPFIMHAATAYSVWAIAQISSGHIRCFLGSGTSATGLDCYIHVWYTKE